MSSTGEFPDAVRQRHGLSGDLETYVTETTRLLDAIDEVFYVCTETGALRRWNEQLGDCVGYSDERLASMTIQDCFEPTVRPRIDDALQKARDTGRSRWEARIETADGQTLPFECTTVTEETEDGTTLLVGTGRTLVDTEPAEEPERAGEQRHFRQMYRVMTEQSLGPAQRIERLLELGRERLGTAEAFLSAIDESSDQLTVTTTTGHGLVTADTSVDLSATYCARTVDCASIVEFGGEESVPEGSFRSSERWGIETYVGGRIVVDDAVYGTICFVDSTSREVGLTPAERSFVEDLRQSIQYVLSRKHEQRRLERAIEAAPIGVSIARLDEPGQPLRYVNEQFEELTGYAKSEVLGERCCMLQGERTDAETACEIQQAIEAQETDTVEILNYRKDGTPFWNRVSVAPLEDESGEVREFVAFQEDVTERKQRERERKRSERRFEAVFNDPQLYVGIGDTDGTTIDVNDRTLDLVDVDREEIIGTPAWETPWWNHSEQLQENLQTWITRAADGEYVEFEADLSAAVEGELVVEGTVRPVTDEHGEVVSQILSAQDVTESRQRERELEATNERLNAVIEASPAALIAVDDQDTVELWNPAAERIFGWSEAEVIDEEIPIIPDIESVDCRRAREVAHDPSRSSFESIRRRKDGSLVDVRISAAALHDSRGDVVGYLGALQDISEQKAYEQRLEQTEAVAAVGGWELDLGEQPPVYYCSDECRRIFGLSDDADLTLERSLELVHPEDGDRLAAAVDRAIEAGERFEHDLRLEPAETAQRWVRVIGEPVATEGTVHTVRGSIQDITDQVEREQRLAHQHDQIQVIVENAPVVLFAIDTDGTFTLSEGAGLEYLGVEPGEVVGESVFDLYAEYPDVCESIERALGGEQVSVTHQLADRYWESWFEPIRGEDDTVDHIIGVSVDVTKREQRKAELHERERQLSTLMDNIPGMMYRCANEPGWPMEFVSEGCAELTGYDAELLESGAVSWGESVIQEGNEELWEAVQDAVEADEPYRVTYPIETADGQRKWCKEQGRAVFGDDGELEALEGVIIDITERKEREQELERTHQLLRQAQRLAAVGGCVIGVEEGTPGRVTWTPGVSELLGVSSDTELTFADAIEMVVPSDRESVTEAVQEAIETGGTLDVECRIRRNGEQRWIRAIGEAVVEDGSVGSVRSAVQDITARKRHQLALESIQDTTRGLLGTESEAEVAELVVSVAAEVLDIQGAAIYGLDPDAGAFRPLSTSAAFSECCGENGHVDVNDSESPIWQTFASGTPTVTDGTTPDTERVLSDVEHDGLLVPIGNHGVFVAVSQSETIDESTRQLVETLVATAEAAFDRLENETALRERDAELEAQNDRLKRQIQINDIIRSINKSLMRVDSRDDVETAVCDRLVEESGIEFAWIGDLDSSGSLAPRTWAGTHPEYLDGVSLDGTDHPADPAYQTAQNESPTVVENILEDVQSANWRKQALLCDFHSAICVPLRYDEYTYGVLTVYADSAGAFADLERTVFEELGETIANSINAVETRRALYEGTALELTLAFDGPESFCYRLADQADCKIVYNGLATDAGETTRLFFTATGTPPDVVEDVLETLVSVSTYARIGDDDTSQGFVATLTCPTVLSRIARHGGRLCSMEASPDGVEVLAELPRETDVREFVSMLDEQFGTVELTARRTVEHERRTVQDHVSSIVDAMTRRQRDVLRTAYFSGFFEWPRESTGEDIADLLDVSQPTINRHLRLAQHRLLTQLFDDGQQ
jgi:PAS domain S-box-containing protein